MAALIIASISQILRGSNSKSKTDIDFPVASLSDSDLTLDLSVSLRNVIKSKNPHISDFLTTGNQQIGSENGNPPLTKTPEFTTCDRCVEPSTEVKCENCSHCGRRIDTQDRESLESSSVKTELTSVKHEEFNFERDRSMEDVKQITPENNINLISHANEMNKLEQGQGNHNFSSNSNEKLSGDHLYQFEDRRQDTAEENNKNTSVYEPKKAGHYQLQMNPMLGMGFSADEDYAIKPEHLSSWNQGVNYTTPCETDRSPSKTSCCSDSGVSAMYTSTPIKNSGGLQDVDGLNSFPTSPQSQSTLITASDSRPGLTLSQTSSYNITPASICDESLSNILDVGDEEFREKYSSWVSQLFHLQLVKMQRRLSHHYSRKIDALNREKHKQILEIQQNNRDKLLEFEQATAKFQKWVETLTEENRRLKTTKDAIVEEMEKSAKQSQSNFHVELDSQINNVQAEFEKEKLLLQKNHAKQLKIFLDKSCGQIEKVESEYRSQVEMLNQTIQDLKFHKENLEDEVQAYKRMCENGGSNTLRSPSAVSGSYCFRREKEHLLSVIQELRNKLYDQEKEKMTMVASHQGEVEKLNACIHKNEKAFMLKWEASQKNFELLHRANDNELQRLKYQIAKQERDSQEIIVGLREKYGSKIHELTEMVERLQIQMEEPNTNY